MTRREDPRLERPAVKANGTVRPSLKPMMKSRIRRPCSVCCSLCGRREVIDKTAAEESLVVDGARGGEVVAGNGETESFSVVTEVMFASIGRIYYDIAMCSQLDLKYVGRRVIWKDIERLQKRAGERIRGSSSSS